VPIGPVAAVKLAQIQGGHRVQHHEHQIVFGQPLAHVHRQQQPLITLREKEVLRHTPGSQTPALPGRRHAVYATGWVMRAEAGAGPAAAAKLAHLGPFTRAVGSPAMALAAPAAI